MCFLHKIMVVLLYLKPRFLLSGSIVIVKKEAVFKVGRGVRILKSKIIVDERCSLEVQAKTVLYRSAIIVQRNTENCSSAQIGIGCSFRDALLHLKGNTIIGTGNIIEKGDSYKKVTIVTNGDTTIGNYNRLRVRIWGRYQSYICIGDYNNINEGSEIRCDDSVTIGHFNQISYDCLIWDTNTHAIYKSDERRKLTITKFPLFGYEYEKPKTSPVEIGNDCWIGRRCSIFKGSKIGNSCIIGFGTIVSNKMIQDNETVMQRLELKIFDNEI